MREKIHKETAQERDNASLCVLALKSQTQKRILHKLIHCKWTLTKRFGASMLRPCDLSPVNVLE